MPRPVKPERGLGQQRGIAPPAGEPGGGREGARAPRGVAGAQQRVAAGEQDRAGLVLGVGERERLERALEALGGVLVGEPLERAAARRGRAGSATSRASAARRRLEQVGGDLLEVAVLAQRAQRLGRAAVQARAAQHVELVVDRLAHERVRELEAAAAAAAGPQQPRAQDLVERGLGGGGLERRRCLQRARVELEPEHRRGGEQLVGGVAEPREPDADGVAHALRHAPAPVSASPRRTSSTKNALPSVRACTRAATLVVAEQRRGRARRRRPRRGRAARCGRARRRAGDRRARRSAGCGGRARCRGRCRGRAAAPGRAERSRKLVSSSVPRSAQWRSSITSSSRRAVGERGVDGVEQAMARAGAVGRAGLQRRRRRRPGAAPRRRARRAASGSSEQRPSSTVAPSASAARGERGGRAGSCRRRARPRAARAAGRGASARRPTTRAAARARRAADERGRRGRARARGGGATGAAGVRRSASSSARVSRDGAIAERARAGARRSARPRRAPRRGRRRSASRSIRRRFGSSASGSSATCSRVRRTASAGSAPRRRAARARRRAARRAPGAPRGPSRRRSRRGSARGTPPARAAGSPASSAASNARVSTASPSPSSATVSRVATRWSAAGPSARRSSVSAARRLVRADSSSTSGQKRAASWARACGPGCSAR